MTTIFYDMDNTLADFSLTNHNALEQMFEKGYFENLEPLMDIRVTIEILQKLGYEVVILSACVDSEFCITEKIKWLNKYLPTITRENMVFTAVGEKKTDYVNPVGNVLVDDYGKNLNDWYNEGGIPVKFASNDRTDRKCIFIRNHLEIFTKLEEF